MAEGITTYGMTINEYLIGKVGFSVVENVLNTILYDRVIEPNTPVNDLTKKERDLCVADLYMWCSHLPNKGGSVKDADGNWSHEEGAYELSVSDKQNFKALATEIYKNYGENVGKSRIKLTSTGFRVW